MFCFCTEIDAEIASIQTQSINLSEPELHEAANICLDAHVSSTVAAVHCFNTPAFAPEVVNNPFTEPLSKIESNIIIEDSDYEDIGYSYDSDGFIEEDNDFNADRFAFLQCNNEIAIETLEQKEYVTTNEVNGTQQDINEHAETETFPDEPSENNSLPAKATDVLPVNPTAIVNRTTTQPRKRGRLIKLVKKASRRPKQKLLRRVIVRQQKTKTDQPEILKRDAAMPASDEDTYFALSLVGCLQRLKPMKKAMAKVNVLRYLTELEYSDKAVL